VRPDQVQAAPPSFFGEQEDGFVPEARVEAVDHALTVSHRGRPVEAETVPRLPSALFLKGANIIRSWECSGGAICEGRCPNKQQVCNQTYEVWQLSSVLIAFSGPLASIGFLPESRIKALSMDIHHRKGKNSAQRQSVLHQQNCARTKFAPQSGAVLPKTSEKL
jgi:hypothetical protein